MTIPQENQTQQNTSQPSVSDKELNFRALQAKYEKQLEQERQARIELERKVNQTQVQDDDDSDEPYVDHKKLEKKLAKFSEKNMQATKSEIQNAVQTALYEERKQNWLRNNPDFYDVMNHAQKFAEKNPELAESILELPEGFERQKVVYANIKAQGVHKPSVAEPSIQQKIDANRRSPYYQPSGVGTAPYSTQGDFSPTGQKNAYDKLQELKKNLRI